MASSRKRKTILKKRYCYGEGRVVPELRLSGVWLEEMGFTGGQKLDNSRSNYPVSKAAGAITGAAVSFGVSAGVGTAERAYDKVSTGVVQGYTNFIDTINNNILRYK